MCLQKEQNKNTLQRTIGEHIMSALIHDLVSLVSIGAFIMTLALWLVAV
jgi:hypothetical protein